MRTSLYVLLILMQIGTSAGVSAQTIVVPTALTNVPGNTANGIPLGLGFIRYQQVYAASEFQTVGSPITISQISFRPDESISVPFSATFTNFQVNLSTTSKAINGLSTTFASNIGADDQIVFQGSWLVSSASTGTPTRLFDVTLTLQQPFVYDYNLGNLLVDIRHNSNASISMLDADFTNNDSISRVFGSIGNATGSADTIGLVTQFSYVAVPEPAAWLLLLSGSFGGILSYAWMRRRYLFKCSNSNLNEYYS